ncbi:MAG: NAD-dependent epimerase/dehydratase family protein [Verrucomicrobiales bacterium]
MPHDLPALVVAGCGYLGQQVVRLWQSRGGQAWGLVSRPEQARLLQQSLHCPVEAADISSPAELRKLQQQGWFPNDRPTCVVHCASTRGGAVEAYTSVFLHGSQALVEVLQPGQIVFTSSTSVYEQTAGEWVREFPDPAPRSERGKVLCAAEQVILQAGGTVLRLSGIYGPGRSIYVKRVLEKAVPKDANPQRYVNQVHVCDAAEAILAAGTGQLESKAVYNVSDGNPVHLRELYQELASLLQQPLHFVEPAAGARRRGLTNKRVSIQTIEAQGWNPKIPNVEVAASRKLLS